MSKIIETQQEANVNGEFGSNSDPGLSRSLRRRWDGVVDLSLANVPLLACCFITGLLDTTMFQGEKHPASLVIIIVIYNPLTSKLP